MTNEYADILDDDFVLEGDQHFLDNIKRLMRDSEEVVWIGKPQYKFSLTPLELGRYDVGLGPINLYFIGLAVSWFYGYRAFTNDNFGLAVFLFALGILVFLIADIIKERRRRRTFYVVTTERVFFKLWKLGKHSLHQFDLTSIHDVRYEVYKNNPGVLYLILKDDPRFKTYDFSVGKSRHYPTFENIENVLSVRDKILQLLKNIR